MEFVLLPRTYRRAKFMRIQSIITTWDRQARAYLAVVTFELTQHVWNCKPMGHLQGVPVPEKICLYQVKG